MFELSLSLSRLDGKDRLCHNQHACVELAFGICRMGRMSLGCFIFVFYFLFSCLLFDDVYLVSNLTPKGDNRHA